MASYLKFLYRQFFITPPKADPHVINLHGQTGIVTGANVDLGLEACRQLLDLGLSHLILAVRNKGKVCAKTYISRAPDYTSLFNTQSTHHFARERHLT